VPNFVEKYPKIKYAISDRPAPIGGNWSFVKHLSYAHGQLRLEQAKFAIARGLSPGIGGKRSVNFHRFGLGDAGGPIDSRVDVLCNHVGLTDCIAAPRGCWRLLELEQKVAIFERKVRKNSPTLSQI
jgi:hypothetical protein